MTAKKILNCTRALVILLAVTMGFIFAMHQDSARTPKQEPPKSINLDEINSKLDRILEEGRARDTVLLQQLLKIQQQNEGVQGNQGRIAEVFDN